ncbi:cytochrome b ascorbate-dependent protein 3-like [Perca fluviatilis]|uniref:cytochrome b ascorbate-dependent protein 3-like n=1 Tax=Perca fluviatilis TaxID=8168 RepID=UPI001962D838|nr:cytochrome b ascorbate-dependent protein 3-like [Perca fluviatilis]
MLVHAGLMLLALLLSVLGLCAVFDFHRGFHIPNLYSLNSWVGICTVLIGSLVWLPGSPLWFHSSTLKPVYIWMGKVMLILCLASCISGINEKLLLTLGNPYNSLPVEAKFENSLGILVAAFGLVVFGILSKNRWQRPEIDSERADLCMAY